MTQDAESLGVSLSMLDIARRTTKGQALKAVTSVFQLPHSSHVKYGHLIRLTIALSMNYYTRYYNDPL